MHVLETAMQLEIDAEKHYRDLAAQTQDVGLVNILNRLADVEHKHQQVIAAMLDNKLDCDAGDDTFISDVKLLCKKLEESRANVTIDIFSRFSTSNGSVPVSSALLNGKR